MLEFGIKKVWAEKKEIRRENETDDRRKRKQNKFLKKYTKTAQRSYHSLYYWKSSRAQNAIAIKIFARDHVIIITYWILNSAIYDEWNIIIPILFSFCRRRKAKVCWRALIVVYSLHFINEWFSVFIIIFYIAIIIKIVILIFIFQNNRW